jgi:hypothetical protein
VREQTSFRSPESHGGAGPAASDFDATWFLWEVADFFATVSFFVGACRRSRSTGLLPKDHSTEFWKSVPDDINALM